MEGVYPTVRVVGLGPGGADGLSPAAKTVLLSGAPVWLRTAVHPAAEFLASLPIAFSTFDSEYDSARRVEDVYPRIAHRLLSLVTSGGQDLVYAVPGHPLFAERSVQLLLEQAPERGAAVEIIPSQSFVDACLTALAQPLGTGLQVLDALSLRALPPDPDLPALLYQVEDRAAASEAKLVLLEAYPPEMEVAVVRAAGVPGRQAIARIPLSRLDRQAFDPLTSVFVPRVPPDARKPNWKDLVAVVARLRGPGGCPWDREQTHASLKRFLVEEAYETLDAIDDADADHLCEELGDVLLQVLLHSEIASEIDAFDVRDVIGLQSEKLIRRHPHVFGDTQAHTAAEVLQNWERIKAGEKASEDRKSVLDGVPKSLPALLRGLEVSRRVVKVGFEWATLEDLWEKVGEELQELRQAVSAGSDQEIQGELGDLLFTLVNIARWMKLDPEECLRTMLHRFERRFRYVEARLAAAGKRPQESTLAEMEALWQEAKGRA